MKLLLIGLQVVPINTVNRIGLFEHMFVGLAKNSWFGFKVKWTNSY